MSNALGSYSLTLMFAYSVVGGLIPPIKSASAQVVNRIAVVEAALGSGWRCALLPDGLKPPGTVYRITQDGVIYEAADFSKHFKVLVAPASIGTFTTTQNYDFALVAALTGLTAAITSTQLQASAGKKYAFSVAVPTASKEITRDDDPGRAAVKKWYAATERDLSSAYFLVRETILTRSLTYHFGKDFAADIAAHANVKKFLKGKVQGNISMSEGFLLSQDYETPVRVCLLPEQILIKGARLAGTTVSELDVDFQPDHDNYFDFSGVEVRSPSLE